MEIFIGLIALIAALVIVWFRRQLSYWRRRGIPHDEPHFLYGNIKGWRKTTNFTELIEPVYKKYKGTGPFAGYYLFFKPAVLVTDIELVKNVLIKDFNHFDDRGVFHNERDDPLTGNLFALDGKRWRGLRHKVSQTFTSGKMKFMFPTVLKTGEEFSDVFGNKLTEAKDGILEITDLLARYTADVIGSCAFGIECNSLRNPKAEFVSMGKRAIVVRRHNKFIDGLIEAFPNVARKLHMRQIAQDVHDFYMGIVKETIDYREKNNVQRNDFMNMLIALKNNKNDDTAGLTFEEIAAQAFVFFLAGFETSSTTMGFALYELAKNQAVQNKLRAHINETLEKHKQEYNYDCMQDMRYLEQVISETLRKYPVLPHLVRTAQSDYQTSDPKYYIEKGSIVIVPSYSIHFDPEYYPDPQRFDPERFTDEEIRKRPACTWLPFGDGPRNCIGLRFGKMQASIGLTFLIRNFKFSFCEKTPNEIVLDNSNVLMSSLGGIHLRVERV